MPDMTIGTLIERAERGLAQTRLSWEEARDERDAHATRCQNERVSRNTDPRWLAANRREAELSATHARIRENLDQIRAAQEDDEVLLDASRVITRTDRTPEYPETSSTTTRMREGYTEERDKRGERSYFSDLFRSQVQNDVGATQRIADFKSERSTGTSAYAGLVVPQYLVDQAALVARLGCPFANSVQHLNMPEQGMSLNVPRATTGSSAAVQSSENTTVSLTDEVWQIVNMPVATIAGQASPSRQSLERGAPGIDQLIFADLAGAYAAAKDVQTLSGTGSSGQVLGVFNTSGVNQASAFTAAATVATFYTKVAGMISTISTARGLPPDTIAMHPRRYAWLLAQFDSSGRPLVTPAPENGPMNVMGVTGEAPTYGTNAGKFLGLSIVVDGNMPTGVGTGPEDEVLVYRSQDNLLYEDDPLPKELKFEQTAGAALTVTLVAYGYIAFTAGRYPAANGIIGGNAGSAGFGLVAPTF